jgi:hypothetical protein
MTVQASSCFDDNERKKERKKERGQLSCDPTRNSALPRERERERERKNKKEKQRDTFREREPSSLVGLIVVLSFDLREREKTSHSLSLFSHTWTKEEFRVIWQFAQQQRAVETTSDDDDE